MTYLTVTFELTETQMEALGFESRQTNLTVNELLSWKIKQYVALFLGIIDAEQHRQRFVEMIGDQIEEGYSPTGTPQNHASFLN